MRFIIITCFVLYLPNITHATLREPSNTAVRQYNALLEYIKTISDYKTFDDEVNKYVINQGLNLKVCQLCGWIPSPVQSGISCSETWL